MKPLLSLCVRGWRASMVGGAIESALAQTVDTVEVVVSDDKGDLEAAVRAFDDPRVSYHRNAERLGPSWNAREALNHGRGDFLFLLNDDDRLLPEFAERTLERFASVPRAGVVFTNLVTERGSDRRVYESPFTDGTYDEFLLPFLKAQWPASDTAVLRRTVWEEGERAHPMPPDTAASSFIVLRAAVLGAVFSYVDLPLLRWTLHDDAITAGPGVHDLVVSLWSSFELSDPATERLRLDHLARAHVERATARLRQRRRADARNDLAVARSLGAPAWKLWPFANLPVPLAPAFAASRRIHAWRRRRVRQSRA
ncbi:MAG TPA: glycosyltransferase family 2 protein [Gaiellaceae bacterium]|nr:glycosyltransferase family 2 protein [Gaiellaceae bacterium]